MNSNVLEKKLNQSVCEERLKDIVNQRAPRNSTTKAPSIKLEVGKHIHIACNQFFSLLLTNRYKHLEKWLTLYRKKVSKILKLALIILKI